MVETLLAAAAIPLAAIAGFLRGRTHRTPRVPICHCGHGMSFHASGDGACHYKSATSREKYNSDGLSVGREYPRCNCQRYLGPQLLETFIAREIYPPEKKP